MWWLVSAAVTFAAGLEQSASSKALPGLLVFCLLWPVWGVLVSSGLLFLALRIQVLRRPRWFQIVTGLVGAVFGTLLFLSLLLPVSLASEDFDQNRLNLFVFSLVMFLAWIASALAVTAAERARRAEAVALQFKFDMAEIELRSMRQQVSSHLVFNALNSILGAVEEGSPAAPQMVMDLSNLLRLSLQKSMGRGTVAEELQRLELFARIVRARFEDTLDLEIKVPAELLPYRCLPLIAQPLVENAVKHGRSPRGSRLHVRLWLKREADSIVLQVKNEGTLKGIGQEGRGMGLGVESVRKRLREEYGVHAFLHFVERVESGERFVIAILRWPLQMVGQGNESKREENEE